jgi:hypothetical protein
MSYKIRYTLKFKDGSKKHYPIELDSETGLVANIEAESAPEWTKLDFHKCSNCTLQASHCPVAVNVSTLVDDFKEQFSYTDVTVVIEAEERNFIKMTDVQTGLQSIFGILMATSGCPHMDLFRPMARFHLPFASIDEHMIRATSFYLLRQLIKHSKGEDASFDLNGLQEIYSNVSTVNQHFNQRIVAVVNKDSNKNAMIGLHTISEMISMEIGSDLTAIEDLVK